jgi:hypothetical protein
MISHELLGLLKDRQSARVVGAEYLRVRSAAADIDTLIGQIFLNDDERKINFVQADPTTRRRIVLRQIRDDFANARTTMVNGWILSQTEASLCALAALIS